MAWTAEQIAWAATVVGTSSEYRGPGRNGADRRNAKEQAVLAFKKQTNLEDTKNGLATYFTGKMVKDGLNTGHNI
jgi:hypothetical protein